MKPQFHNLLIGTLWFWGIGLVLFGASFAYRSKSRAFDGGCVQIKNHMHRTAHTLSLIHVHVTPHHSHRTHHVHTHTTRSLD